jgi:hypothetical protein
MDEAEFCNLLEALLQRKLEPPPHHLHLSNVS